jgi:GT2 family glycosyltransferase
MSDPGAGELGIVVIGRNEGERLVRCLASLGAEHPVVYVDSGSSDASVANARRSGAVVVELDMSVPFTAARARNAGVAALRSRAPHLCYVQTIDGDCELLPDWLPIAAAVLAEEPGIAIVLGRLRERFPERSIYNALCDHEWDGPAGEAPGCGGIALIRLAALNAVGGYRAGMIAGEDTEMAMRVRKAGWRLWRLRADMALHDAEITRFGQWWRRQRRGGHGFAEMAWLHPDARWPNWARTCRSIVAWGLVLPMLTILSAIVALATGDPWLLLVPAALLSLWPAKMLQIALAKHHDGLPWRIAGAAGVFMMVGKVAELQGLVRFHVDRRSGRDPRLIEYKGPAAS